MVDQGWLRGFDMKTFYVIVLSISLSLVFSVEGFGGTIRSAITTGYTIDQKGRIDIDAEVLNTGDEIAHNVVATIFIADWVGKVDDLGNNPPGGKIRFRSRIPDAALKPGNYIGVTRIFFEERNGLSHRAYHFFEISHAPDRAIKTDQRLSLQTKAPLFNKKAFWQSSGKLRITFRNGFQDPITPVVSLYLPDHFRSTKPHGKYRITPAEERSEFIPILSDSPPLGNRPYHLVVWYEHEGVHYSHHLKGSIRVEEKAVYFRWYVLLGLISVIVFLGITLSGSRQ